MALRNHSAGKGAANKMYERIRMLREDRHLSQAAVAKILCVAQTTYSDYERGKLNIPIPTLIRLSQLHNTSIDYLLGLTDERAPYIRRDIGA